MFESISGLMAAVTIAFTAPLLAALNTSANLPANPPLQIQQLNLPSELAPTQDQTPSFQSTAEELDQSEAEIQNQQELQQADMLKMTQNESLDQIKKIALGEEKSILTVKSATAEAEKQGMSVSADNQSLISTIEDSVNLIKNSSEISDDVTVAVQTIRDNNPALQQLWEEIQAFRQWPEQLTSANSELVRLRKQFNQAKSHSASTHIDISGITSDIDSEISNLEKSRDSLKNTTKESANPQDLIDSLDENVLSPIPDIQNDINILQNISNIKIELRKIDTVLKNSDIRLAHLAKTVKNVSDLKQSIFVAKQQRSAINDLFTNPELTADDLFAAVSGLESRLNEIDQGFTELESSAQTPLPTQQQ